MKTLDEVIKALEWCIDDSHDDCDGCPYDTGEATDCHVRNIDALHYLKELKDILDPLKVKKISHEITCPQCNSVIAILLPESNEPLTWQELRQMEGKPVWIEEYGEKGEWYLINYVDGEHMSLINNVFDEEFADEELMGGTWQAYRKERS